jgi:peptide/nickel transport system permease protein
MMRSGQARAGIVIVCGIFLAAFVAPLIFPLDSSVQDLPNRLQGPTWRHWFGLDELGRDILARVLLGARVSLLVGVVVVGVSSIVGMAVGAISGYYGGHVDQVIGRVMDVLMAFPGMLLAIALVAVLGPSLVNVVIALAVIGWVGYARLVRGQVLRAREFEYVTAAGSW